MLYKFCFYVPLDSVEAVKAAVFATGAGRIGNYDNCCWQVNGQGQFRPLEGANPSIGSTGSLEYVDEAKVELVCEASLIRKAVKAMIAAHPYEEPAYQAWPVMTLDDLPEESACVFMK